MHSPPFRFLDVPEALEPYLGSLRKESSFALDLEADSLHSYREKVCLVQFSTLNENAIVDPFTCREALRGLGPLLADHSVQKVLHGGDYDVRLLKKDFGFQFGNLFDTMIAAQFTGREQFGLAALLEEHFGLVVDKRHQRSDWSQRPLGEEMLAYAVMDTVHLLSLRDSLREELSSLGRLAWAEEEFCLLAGAEPAPSRAPWCLDVKGAARMPPPKLAILQSLLEVRDAAAGQWDRPPFKVLSNEVLLGWAAGPPATRRDVMETRGAPKPVLARLAEEVLEAVRCAQQMSPERWPRPPTTEYTPFTGAQERRLKRLKGARSEAAQRLALGPGLLVNSANLERFARMDPEIARDAVKNVLKRWQFEVIGGDLMKAIAGP